MSLHYLEAGPSSPLLEELSSDWITTDLLLRGSTPDNIDEQCLALCREYLGGSWNNATSGDDVLVQRLAGGLTNQLYRVQLADGVPRAHSPKADDPNTVVVKFYLSKYSKTQVNRHENERHDDLVIMSRISNLDIGPKVYGVFHDGIIQAYVEHDQFTVKHQQSNRLVKRAADLLAKIHHLEVPIRTNDPWPVNEIDRRLKFAYTKTSAPQLAEALDLELFLANDLRQEFREVKNWMRDVNSPNVFSHNDFLGSNILVTKREKLMIVDFEYSSYFARGFDIAVFHSKWGIDPYQYANQSFPDDEVFVAFLRSYAAASEKLEPGFIAKPENSIDKMLREAKIYLLAYLIYVMAVTLTEPKTILKTEEHSEEDNLIYVENAIRRYLEIKNRLLQDGTINYIGSGNESDD